MKAMGLAVAQGAVGEKSRLRLKPLNERYRLLATVDWLGATILLQ